jgi:hypothetical protein
MKGVHRTIQNLKRMGGVVKLHSGVFCFYNLAGFDYTFATRAIRVYRVRLFDARLSPEFWPSRRKFRAFVFLSLHPCDPTITKQSQLNISLHKHLTSGGSNCARTDQRTRQRIICAFF